MWHISFIAIMITYSISPRSQWLNSKLFVIRRKNAFYSLIFAKSSNGVIANRVINDGTGWLFRSVTAREDYILLIIVCIWTYRYIRRRPSIVTSLFSSHDDVGQPVAPPVPQLWDNKHAVSEFCLKINRVNFSSKSVSFLTNKFCRENYHTKI